jgi:hypothetical protein
MKIVFIGQKGMPAAGVGAAVFVKADGGAGGMLSNDASINPQMHAWSKVFGEWERVGNRLSQRPTEW